MKNSIVLMTALIPTTGHADLIEFASSIPYSYVYVLINGRTCEPVKLKDRVDSLQEHFSDYPNIIIKGSMNDNAPQEPQDMEEGFWEWWEEEINNTFPQVDKNWHFVVASEPYGLNVAQTLHAEFIPYDLQREINPIKGEKVRNDIIRHWTDIIAEFRPKITHNIVLFGQESVGKTTLSKLLAKELPATQIMEFARPYLESVGKDLSEDKMMNIVLGQSALQRSIRHKAPTPINIFDTDLFSTAGYYKLWNGEIPQKCIDLAYETSSDKYYILPDDIPFEPDILRYGIKERETNTSYWVEILEEFELPYMLVPKGALEEKIQFISEDIMKDLNKKFNPIKTFQR